MRGLPRFPSVVFCLCGVSVLAVGPATSVTQAQQGYQVQQPWSGDGASFIRPQRSGPNFVRPQRLGSGANPDAYPFQLPAMRHSNDFEQLELQRYLLQRAWAEWEQSHGKSDVNDWTPGNRPYSLFHR